jgi:hypothetical protein
MKKIELWPVRLSAGFGDGKPQHPHPRFVIVSVFSNGKHVGEVKLPLPRPASRRSKRAGRGSRGRVKLGL